MSNNLIVERYFCRNIFVHLAIHYPIFGGGGGTGLKFGGGGGIPCDPETGPPTGGIGGGGKFCGGTGGRGGGGMKPGGPLPL